jgi:ubiquinone/menaquinone biosynthesis C-methylase UbiE
MKRIVPHLDREDRILDVGAASCTVTEWLMERDLKVVPLDVRNYSIVDSISPMLYEGKIIPFKDDHFGASLILFVLHHTHEPEKLLKEAMRVSARIIVCEDVVLSPAHKWMTSMADMLINLEFDDQPHTNKSDVEWQALFRSLGLKLLHREYRTYGLVFRHALYVVEK